MRILSKLALAIPAIIMLPPLEAGAHHSFSMFDNSLEEVVQGTVVRWAFNSPHVFLYIEDEGGELWAFEGAAPPSILGRRPQMTGSTFQIGEAVTVVHCPLRDGRNGGGVGVVLAADSIVYDPSDGGCDAEDRMEEWPQWIEMGFTSKVEAEEALGLTDASAGAGEGTEEATEGADEDTQSTGEESEAESEASEEEEGANP